MADIHFICGHRESHQGAAGLDIRANELVSEWQYAMSLKPMLNTAYHFKDAYNLHENEPFIEHETLALEFHLNSFHSHVEGYEVLILGNDIGSYIMAEKFLRIMKNNFPNRRRRGIKVITEQDRGYNNLLRLKKFYKRAIITEMFFLNTPNDWIDRKDAAKVINEFNNAIKA